MARSSQLPLLLGSLVFLGSATTRTLADEITGSIRRVVPDRGQLSVAQRDGKEWQFQTRAETKIRLRDAAAKLADLKPGYAVRVVYEEKNKVFLASEIVSQGLTGRVQRLSPDRNEMVLKDAEGREWTLRVERDSFLSIDGRDEKLEDLRPGYSVRALYQEMEGKEVASRIEASRPKTKSKNGKPKPKIEPPPKVTSSLVESDKFAVVKVFYGTDRGPEAVPGGSGPDYLKFILIGCLVLLFLLATLFWFLVRSKPLRWTSGLVALAMLFLAPAPALFWPPPPRPKGNVSYGGDRGELHYGICEVSIPKSHQIGQLETPSIFRLEFEENPEKHVVLQKVEIRPAEQFFAELRGQVDRSSKKDAFVFVHGFNVAFADAARRTAQLAYDLKFEGAPILYSWPSQAGLLQYTVDETNNEWTIPHLKVFLADLSSKSGAQTIHLVAHSMGNRALTRALQLLNSERTVPLPAFNEVVLTAPDIDADIFKRDIYPAIVGTARRVTLYASSTDRALVASKQVHGYRRAGDIGEGMIVLPKMDTIDVSAVDTTLVGHSYYGDNTTFLADLYYLVREGLPASGRQRLQSRPFGDLKYWVFTP